MLYIQRLGNPLQVNFKAGMRTKYLKSNLFQRKSMSKVVESDKLESGFSSGNTNLKKTSGSGSLPTISPTLSILPTLWSSSTASSSWRRVSGWRTRGSWYGTISRAEALGVEKHWFWVIISFCCAWKFFLFDVRYDVLALLPLDLLYLKFGRQCTLLRYF